MANRPIIDNGSGAIGRFPAIVLKEEGMSEIQAGWLSSAIAALCDLANGAMSFGTGDHATRAGNFHGQWIQQYFLTANVEVEIPHGLNKRPTDAWFGIPSGPCRFYSARRGSWNEKTIWIACDAPGITVPILVF